MFLRWVLVDIVVVCLFVALVLASCRWSRFTSLLDLPLLPSALSLWSQCC